MKLPYKLIYITIIVYFMVLNTFGEVITSNSRKFGKVKLLIDIYKFPISILLY